MATSTKSAPAGDVPYLTPDGYLDGSYEGSVKIRKPLGRLLAWYVPTNITVFLLWGATTGILLATQVSAIDPANKQASLAVVTSFGAFAAMIAQPLAGVISDRTRSRFGRRAPIMVFAALIGGLALVSLGAANTIVTMALCWVAVQISYNFVQGPLSAVMPDRVPKAVRGLFSSGMGLATMGGMIAGQIYGTRFAGNVSAGYIVLGVLVFVLTVLFVLFNPDRPSTDVRREPFSIVAFLKTFWVSPTKHPDFFFAFAGRFLLGLGFTIMSVYQLYILQDYIGLGDGALEVVPLIALVQLASLLVTVTVSGPISDRIGRRKIFVLIASVVLGASLIIPVISPTLTAVIVMAVIGGLGYGCFQAVDTALISEVLPSKEGYGKDLGVINIAATLPQALAPALAGAVYLGFGESYAAVYIVAAVIAVASAFFVIPIKGVR
ncbi:MFS transporter [Propionicicella superfundia]|uniref:MFS transporter n=1 Tax=Propionicicella superfundia TaxID=348582 RepID=UPI00055A1D9E|nr:MFS transporter [Propionicicella superfundia]